MSKRDKKITITRDGPYEVSGGVPLTRIDIVADENGDSAGWEKGARYEHDEPYRLCRCGHSRNKPFCDGTHEDAEFCGRERADRGTYAERARVLEGEAVDLADDSSLCAGARFCDKGETVWGYVESSDVPGHRERAVEEACNCPAGRLTVVEKDGAAIDPELDQEICAVVDPRNNWRGPLWVRGGIPIEGPDGERYEVRNRVTLCRCGQSRNQPYCDGSHYNCPEMRGVDE